MDQGNRKMYYSGDINLEEGGLFYELKDDRLVEALEVRPHPSNPSLPYDEEQWYVNSGYIVCNKDNLQDALDTCGYTLVENGIQDPTGAVITGEEALRLTIEAYFAYGGVESDGHGDDVIERSEFDETGVSLFEYVRKEYENYLLGVEIVGGPKESNAPSP